ncbi:hypothetical protein [Photobacterium nomapromontoriensis]|uniref:hypothetical protein n=1 Tax=Photobacterium nomapromontoriensis TaxID=2910237 RepID=UPI003D0CD272
MNLASIIFLFFIFLPQAHATSVKHYKNKYAGLPCSGLVTAISNIEMKYKHTNNKKIKARYKKEVKALGILRKKNKCFGRAYH